MAKLPCHFAFALNTPLNFITGTTIHEIVFGFKPEIQISSKLGLARDDNDLYHSEFCQSLAKHTHVNRKTSPSCIDNFLSPRSSIDLLNPETQIKNKYCKVYRKVREANHRSLSYENKYKLSKPLRIGRKDLLEIHDVPFGKKNKKCAISEVVRTLWLKY